MTRAPVPFDLRSIGKHMSRRRYRRGTLSTSVPGTANRPERKLPRGTFWGQWYQYVRQPDGSETRRRREKIITKDLAVMHGIARDYEGPLTKTDAQRVLEALIAEESGVYVPPDTEATLEQVAREYLALSEANWGPHTQRASTNLIETHLIGKLGSHPLARLTTVELQAFMNDYVNEGVSSSLLTKILRHLRGILDLAVVKRVIIANPARNPAYKLRAKSRKRPSNRALSIEECRRLLSVVVGRDHLIVRMFVQLGLRPEEMFALRYDDVQGDTLRIDEAIVNGVSAPVKTYSSEAGVYVPPDLGTELRQWIELAPGDATAWLFPASRGGCLDHKNYLNRVLKPAAIRAGLGLRNTGSVTKTGTPIFTTDVNFQVLRRTCATLFGDKARDPKSTQAQLRHANPQMTLKHYQQSIPAAVKAAAVALEADILNGQFPISGQIF